MNCAVLCLFLFSGVESKKTLSSSSLNKLLSDIHSSVIGSSGEIDASEEEIMAMMADASAKHKKDFKVVNDKGSSNADLHAMEDALRQAKADAKGHEEKSLRLDKDLAQQKSKIENLREQNRLLGNQMQTRKTVDLEVDGKTKGKESADSAKKKKTMVNASAVQKTRGTSFEHYQDWRVRHAHVQSAARASMGVINDVIKKAEADDKYCGKRLLGALRTYWAQNSTVDDLEANVISNSKKLAQAQTLKQETIPELIKDATDALKESNDQCDKVKEDAESAEKGFQEELDLLTAIAQPNLTSSFVEQPEEGEDDPCKVPFQTLRDDFSTAYQTIESLKKAEKAKAEDTKCYDDAKTPYDNAVKALQDQESEQDIIIAQATAEDTALKGQLEVAKLRLETLNKHINDETTGLKTQCAQYAHTKTHLKKVIELMTSLQMCPGKESFKLSLPPSGESSLIQEEKVLSLDQHSDWRMRPPADGADADEKSTALEGVQAAVGKQIEQQNNCYSSLALAKKLQSESYAEIQELTSSLTPQQEELDGLVASRTNVTADIQTVNDEYANALSDKCPKEKDEIKARKASAEAEEAELRQIATASVLSDTEIDKLKGGGSSLMEVGLNKEKCEAFLEFTKGRKRHMLTESENPCDSNLKELQEAFEAAVESVTQLVKDLTAELDAHDDKCSGEALKTKNEELTPFQSTLDNINANIATKNATVTALMNGKKSAESHKAFLDDLVEKYEDPDGETSCPKIKSTTDRVKTVGEAIKNLPEQCHDRFKELYTTFLKVPSSSSLMSSSSSNVLLTKGFDETAREY